MNYQILKEDSNNALKQGNKLRRLVLSDICASIEAASIKQKSRTIITDELVDEVLTKYKKTVQEMIDTCPTDKQHSTKLAEYKAKMAIVEEYAPKLITDYQEINDMISYWISQDINAPMDNKGTFMKDLMPCCKKAHMDMKVASKVLNDMWINYEASQKE